MTDESLDDIYLAGKNPAYDALAKKLIATKTILSWILKYCVEEFKDTPLSDIRNKYIIGTPEVASTPVAPDFTNAERRIAGENAEIKTLTEGTTTFDIRFQARSPEGDDIALIINVEAQQKFNTPYPLIKRALYYCSRLISSQNEIEFTNSHYEKVKKVYSIWLCMHTPEGRSGIGKYTICEDRLFDAPALERKHYDLQQVVMVYIGKGKIQSKFLSMLYILFNSNHNAEEKRNILENEYELPLDLAEERMVGDMCNLSVGVYSEGYDEGRNDGIAEGSEMTKRAFTLRMLQNHMPMDIIIQITAQPEGYVRRIAEEEHIEIK